VLDAMNDLFALLDEALSRDCGARVLCFDGVEVTCRCLQQRVEALRVGMSELGVQQGHVAGLVMDEPSSAIAAVLALMRLDAHIVMLPKSISGEFMRTGSASFLICGRELSEPAEGGWSVPRNVDGLNVYIAACDKEPTRGGVFAVGCDGRTVEIALDEIREHCLRSRATGGSECILLRAAGTHPAAMLKLVCSTLASGGTLVLDEDASFDLGKLLEKFRTWNVTALYLNAGELGAILQHELPRHELLRSTLRRLVCEAWHLDRSTIERARGLCHSEVLLTYPLYDLGHDTYTISIPALGWDASRAEVMADSFVVALDSYGRQLPPGAEGELHIIAGPGVHGAVTKGLQRGRSITRIVAENDSLQSISTGLIGRQHRDGLLQLSELSRGATMMGGRLCRFEPIEAQILRLEAVKECFVTMRYQQGSPRLIAYLAVSEPGCLEERDVVAFLQGRVPPLMVPQSYVFTSHLPVDHFGRLDVSALRDVPVFDDALFLQIRAELNSDPASGGVDAVLLEEWTPCTDEGFLHIADLGDSAVGAAKLMD
jgi:acyl-coenzyme A synthetase/AMP-(fatty) acid ligase